MSAKKARKRAYIPPASEVVNRRERSTSKSSSRPTQRQSARAAYEPPVPSIQRTLKRLPLYFVMMVVLQYVFNAKTSASPLERIGVAAATAALITLCFAPFMHMMDKAAYNRWQKRNSK